eukprot:TRINITY_DN10300_c0_g1_i3.p1 TRINITY_DN10300_c0_g1~~TRINITY_DN10300_c0_g1_i3.p1  ORF type:complete len:548 (-),score=84.65 TRINITY_DN10300_c0_g1_i3:65-1708(-)
MLTMPGFSDHHISKVIGAVLRQFKQSTGCKKIKRSTGCLVHFCGKDSNRPTNEDNHLLIRSDDPQSVIHALQEASDIVFGVLSSELTKDEHEDAWSSSHGQQERTSDDWSSSDWNQERASNDWSSSWQKNDAWSSWSWKNGNGVNAYTRRRQLQEQDRQDPQDHANEVEQSYPSEAPMSNHASGAKRSHSKHGYEIIYESACEAKLMLTMPGFLQYHLSRVIGKRGSNLTELSRKSSCKVHLCGKDSNRPTNEDNHLLIRSSNPQSVVYALQTASEVVFEVLGNALPICETCGGDHKNRDCPLLSVKLEFKSKIRLDPDIRVGFIVGSGGRNLQPIKDETGASIRVLGQGSGSTNEIDPEPLHLLIECVTQEGLDRAVQMTQELVNKVQNYSPYGDEKPPEGYVFAHRHKIYLDELLRETDCYDAVNAHIYGKSGRNLKEIRDVTGAWLWLRGKGSGYSAGEGSKEPLHLLLEHDDAVCLEEASKLTLKLLDSVCRKLGQTYCRLCGGQHFSYRCMKTNSMGFLKETAARGLGEGTEEHEAKRFKMH